MEIIFVLELECEMRELKKKKSFRADLIDATMDEPNEVFRWVIGISRKVTPESNESLIKWQNIAC
jgi:hypothetical protein